MRYVLVVLLVLFATAAYAQRITITDQYGMPKGYVEQNSDGSQTITNEYGMPQGYIEKTDKDTYTISDQYNMPKGYIKKDRWDSKSDKW
jgi:hypothetical protein